MVGDQGDACAGCLGRLAGDRDAAGAERGARADPLLAGARHRGADLDQPGRACAVKRISARYTRPYQMHGSIGPPCALAMSGEDGVTVWTHTQGVFPWRAALAQSLRLPSEQVRCLHVEGSGRYGHNGADDVAADAALIARAVPGRPVRVQWMREQEHTSEPYGPAMVAEVSGSLDADGRHRRLGLRR
jgi:nicotinate dehydrogenase subunit B